MKPEQTAHAARRRTETLLRFWAVYCICPESGLKLFRAEYIEQGCAGMSNWRNPAGFETGAAGPTAVTAVHAKETRRAMSSRPPSTTIPRLEYTESHFRKMVAALNNQEQRRRDMVLGFYWSSCDTQQQFCELTGAKKQTLSEVLSHFRSLAASFFMSG